MRWSQAFIPTLRDAPADAEAVSHKLLVRGGYMRQLMSGSYSMLPLGQRVVNKIEAIVRAHDDPRVGFHRQAVNEGEYGQARYFLSACEEEYFAILHDDDVLEPAYLERAVERLDTRSARPCRSSLCATGQDRKTVWSLTSSQRCREANGKRFRSHWLSRFRVSRTAGWQNLQS